MSKKQISQRQEKIEGALREMIDLIENYFLATPFKIIEGLDGSAADYLFPDISGHWEVDWTKRIFPVWATDEESIDQAIARFNFVFGVLVGCKAMGATHEQLLQRAHGFVLPQIKALEALHGKTE